MCGWKKSLQQSLEWRLTRSHDVYNGTKNKRVEHGRLLYGCGEKRLLGELDDFFE